MLLKQSGSEIFLDTYALEIYLPYDYTEKTYRGNAYYSVIGSKVQFFGVGNMRFYQTQKAMDSPMTVKCHPLGCPVMILSSPTEIDTRDVQFSKGGPIRKCIVLTYYKGDSVVSNTACIKRSENVMIALTRLESGKFNHLSPETAYGILQDCQTMNGLSLRIPPEVEAIFVAERYRDPAHPSQKARFGDPAPAPDQYLSYNMRQEAMKSTTYQAITHEDINASLITAINKKNKGIVDQPTTMERIVRGMDMTELVEDRDRRIKLEQSQEKHEGAEG